MAEADSRLLRDPLAPSIGSASHHPAGDCRKAFSEVVSMRWTKSKDSRNTAHWPPPESDRRLARASTALETYITEYMSSPLKNDRLNYANYQRFAAAGTGDYPAGFRNGLLIAGLSRNKQEPLLEHRSSSQLRITKEHGGDVRSDALGRPVHNKPGEDN